MDGQLYATLPMDLLPATQVPVTQTTTHRDGQVQQTTLLHVNQNVQQPPLHHENHISQARIHHESQGPQTILHHENQVPQTNVHQESHTVQLPTHHEGRVSQTTATHNDVQETQTTLHHKTVETSLKAEAEENPTGNPESEADSPLEEVHKRNKNESDFKVEMSEEEAEEDVLEQEDMPRKRTRHARAKVNFFLVIPPFCFKELCFCGDSLHR